MKALQLVAVMTVPALLGLISEPLAWLALFTLPILFAVVESKKKG